LSALLALSLCAGAAHAGSTTELTAKTGDVGWSATASDELLAPGGDTDPVAVTVSCSNARNAKTPCSKFGNFLAACAGLNGEGSCQTSGCTCTLPDNDAADMSFDLWHLAIDDGAITRGTDADSGQLGAKTLTSAGSSGGWQIDAGFASDDGSPGVDLDAMEDAIRTDLIGNVVGFAYVIAQDGVPMRAGGWGSARRGSDGQVPMTEHRTINIASVSKTLTAVATLQLLEANGLSTEDFIWPFLPPDWDLGPGVADLKFRHLLQHRTGWNQMFKAMTKAEQEPWGNDWDGIAFVVSQGATPGAGYSYKNANFAVLRMIIPALYAASGQAPFAIPPLTKWNYSLYYVAYMQEHLFEPAGIYGAGCWDYGGDQTAYAYDVDDPSIPGRPPGNNFYDCGGHSNFVLSAMQLASIMAHVRYDDTVFSAANRLRMDGNKLGWNRRSNDPDKGRLGKYWHGGDLFVGSGRQFHACVMKYPQQVEATLVINSDIAGGKSQCSTLKDAFNNALP
jgi:CubicO group peptidase (beta-lactamase class C family)